ncbi:MAG: AAA family ATPase [Leadbetterella sp.]
MFVGRDLEKEILLRTLRSKSAELIVIYGRRRVGKTYMIRSIYKEHIRFEFIGEHEASLKKQLENFSTKLDQFQDLVSPSVQPQSWTDAFERLKKYLIPILKKKPGVVFIDEFPWLDTARSGFLGAFEYFWNDWASKNPNLKIVICGSAASWMIEKVILNKGGLHNRVTRKIRLLPFNLQETEEFLKSKSIYLDRYQITQLYMTTGGIPHYLKEIERGESVSQAINRLCFTKDGLLFNEYDVLFEALFKNHHTHQAIIQALAEKTMGFSRNELAQKINKNTGGTLSQVLTELIESGFVQAYVPFGKNQNSLIYKLADEYSLFYIKFIHKSKFKGEDKWATITNSQSYKSWCGFAFESVCFKHIQQIKNALGIAGVYTEISTWRQLASETLPGAQIDLIIDRKDQSINICEMKFSSDPYLIDKSYASTIQTKLSQFRQSVKTRKTLYFTGVSTSGFVENEYSSRWLDKEIKLDDLFKKP